MDWRQLATALVRFNADTRQARCRFSPGGSNAMPRLIEAERLAAFRGQALACRARRTQNEGCIANLLALMAGGSGRLFTHTFRALWPMAMHVISSHDRVRL